MPEAYECLSNTVERAAYNRKLDTANLPRPDLRPSMGTHNRWQSYPHPQSRHRSDTGRYAEPYAGFKPTYSYTAPEDGGKDRWDRPPPPGRERARYQPRDMSPSSSSEESDSDDSDVMDDIPNAHHRPFFSRARRQTGHNFALPPFPSPFILHNLLRATFPSHRRASKGFPIDPVFAMPIPPFAEIERMLRDLGVNPAGHASAARARAGMARVNMHGRRGQPMGHAAAPIGHTAHRQGSRQPFPSSHAVPGPRPGPSMPNLPPRLGPRVCLPNHSDGPVASVANLADRPSPGWYAQPGHPHPHSQVHAHPLDTPQGMPPRPPRMPIPPFGPHMARLRPFPQHPQHNVPPHPLPSPSVHGHMGGPMSRPPVPPMPPVLPTSAPVGLDGSIPGQPQVRQAAYRYLSPDGNVQGFAHVSHTTWAM